MKCLASVFIAASLLFANVSSGQSTRERASQSFAGKSPAVGDSLPNLQAYDAAGETIQLGQLKGSYTVLVFGCLT